MKSICMSVFVLCFSLTAIAEKPPQVLRYKGGMAKSELIHKADDIVWGFEFLDDNKMLVTLKEGKLLYIDRLAKSVKEVSHNIKTVSANQGGFMDVLKDINFSENNFVYFTYTVEKDDKYSTALARAEFVSGKLQNLKQIFLAEPFYSETRHFGSRVLQDTKGHLYLTIGDRGNRDLAQSLETHNGKVVRINRDGEPVKDNPFFSKEGAKKEIFSFGHRNPQGATFRPGSDDVYIAEHGPRGGDEVNLVKKGVNYGWPVITYGREYWGPKIGPTHKEGMEQPLFHYTPSIAISGLVIHSGKMFTEWKGDFFSGALKETHISRYKKSGGKFSEVEKLLEDWDERIRQIKEGPDGSLYVSTDSGHIVRFFKVTGL